MSFRDAAERMNQEKDRFLATLGHELRNPLAAIATGIELLQMGLSEERMHWVHKRIDAQAAQLTSLINDLLDTNRISHGKLTLRKERVSLRAVIAGAVDSCRQAIEERAQTLEVTPDATETYIDADPVRLEQVLSNLLCNAAKYTPDGGKITLKTHSENGSIELAVSDTGIGLSKSDIDKIFEPFAQVGAPSQGLGIGLTLVRQLVELHGGSVTAESEGLGRGSTFRVRLPQATVETVQEADQASSGHFPQRRRILIVDDNQNAALMQQMLLRNHGYPVEVAFTGEDALQEAERFQPDLILLDIGLPDISGYEVAKRLRKAGFENATIAALSGFSHEEAKDRLQEARFDGHLIKPANLGQIEALLNSNARRTST